MKYLAGVYIALGAVVAFIISLLRMGSIPDRMPMHWNLAGQVDRYGSKWEALFFLPVLMIVLSVVFLLIGLVSNRRLGPNAVKGMNLVSIALVVFLLVIHNSILSSDPNRIIKALPMLMSGLLLVLGFAIRGVEPNPFIGIRVPWTMNSPSVWRKTHDRASKLWIWGGAVGMVAAVAGIPMALTILIFTVCLLYPLFDSYKISRTAA